MAGMFKKLMRKKALDAAAKARSEGQMFSDDPLLFSHDKETVTLDDFELLSVVGKGSFGKVMQVRKRDGQIFAMKVLRKSALIERNQIDHTKFERRFLESTEHPFLVTLRYAFQTEDKLYMILDYCNGGELFFHLKREGRFTEERVQLYLAELTLAIEHLHRNNVIYRDLKPENILLTTEGHVRITDFGLSKQFEENVPLEERKTHTFCGTPEYLAPEILMGTGHDERVDWWSLGTLTYEMLAGLPPFYSQNVNVMYHKILAGDIAFPEWFSEEVQDLIVGLMQRDPDNRLKGEVGGGIREHPFFASLDWDEVYHLRVEPVYRPPVKNLQDSSLFDPEFTGEAAVDSLVEQHLSGSDKEAAAFEGFTFTRQSEIGAAAERSDKGRSNTTEAERDVGDLSPSKKSSPKGKRYGKGSGRHSGRP